MVNQTVRPLVFAMFGLVAALGVTAASAAGPDTAYTVANYPVFATAKNAVEAKRAALKDGQQSALRSLLKRIVPVTAYGALRALPEPDANRFVAGMSVKSEQNSSVEYIATMDFLFSPDAVRKHLQQKGVPFIDTQAAQAILVPITKASGGTGVAGGLGQWGKTWKELDLANSVAPLRVAAAKSSLSGDVLEKLEANTSGAVREFTSGYGSPRAIAAIADHDRAASKLKVTLVGRDAVGAFFLNRSYPVADGDLAYALEYAAVVSQGILEGRWKATQSRIQGGGGLGQPLQQVLVEVYFNSPAQWYEIEGQLRTLPGVDGFQTNGVSARGADIALRYPGGGAQLRSVLARQGYTLTAAGQRWVLRRTF